DAAKGRTDHLYEWSGRPSRIPVAALHRVNPVGGKLWPAGPARIIADTRSVRERGTTTGGGEPMGTQQPVRNGRGRSGMFRTKTVEQSIRDTEEPEHVLKKSLSALDLTVFGVGVVIGTGIFVLTGKVAKENAGPSVSLAFVVAGVVCALAALCYAEFASTVPVAGSAYTFSYATLGELPAWIIGWDLVLEFTLGTAVVAVGWSGYIRSLLDNAGRHLPGYLSGREAAHGFGFDILAAALVLVLTAILVIGVKLSARVTQLVVAVKVTVVLIVIIAGAFFISGANYAPFVPKPRPVAAQGSLSGPLVQLMFCWTP